MDRPFLTIEQQVERLERRGMRTSGETAGILMREGYYSVVNVYKAPFIDAEASKEAGDEMALTHVFNEAGMSKLADELGRRSAIMAEAIAGSERDN